MSSVIKRAHAVRSLLNKGYNYPEIAEILGISEADARKPTRYGDYFREDCISKVKYTGLRNWMLTNRVTINKLNELTGLTSIHQCIIDRRDPSKHTIDAILRVTGLTYEECFREESGDTK